MPTPLFHRCFPHEPHHWSCYLDAIEKALPTEGKVLDLGCGSNSTLAALRSAKREIWGTDLHIHPHLVDEKWFRHLTDERIPFPSECFDLIASSWVLEHVRRPRAFLSEVARVLRPGGMFIAHTVNARHYVALAGRILGALPHRLTQMLVEWLYRRPHFDTHPALYRLNTREAVERSCCEAGLELQDVRSYADPFYFQFSKPALNAAVALDWLLERCRPGLGRIYMTFTMRKPRTTQRHLYAAA